MLISSSDAPADLRSQVCVVGAGAAGISLAIQLARAGVSVLLVEGGGLAYSQSSQGLYFGRANGDALAGNKRYLTSSRLRYFGGTSNHWHGWCRPLDSLDFEQRPWVENSGWPVTREELGPYYERAADLVGISSFDYAPQDRLKGDDALLLPPESGVETSFFHISGPTRFGQAFREELQTSDRIQVVLDANVVRIGVNEGASAVQSLEVISRDERRLEVKADAFVLCAGGIENARLMLAASDVPQGLGNQGDQLGRNFMDHPLLSLGSIVVPGKRRRLGSYEFRPTRDRRHQVVGTIRLSDAVQEEHGLLNAIFVLRSELPRDAPDLAWAAKDVAADTFFLESEGRKQLPPGSTYFGRVELASEHAPNSASRVTLMANRDRLGMRKVNLEWSMSEVETRSIRTSAEILARELGARHWGRAMLRLDANAPWQRARPSNHHMGTTRMHPDPKLGVVDTNSQVHGMGNLYVGGSSVFPTSGASNPTLTLLALTVRLGDHLEQRFAD